MAELSNRYVIKRDGTRQKFNINKIYDAIGKANRAADNEMNEIDIKSIVSKVSKDLENERHRFSIELIQDLIEKYLVENNFYNTVKKYILYRDLHNKRREAGKNLLEQYKSLFFEDAKNDDSKRDNANVDGNAPMGIMLKLGTEAAKVFTDNYIVPERFLKAEREHWVYYHDKDFSLITANCLTTDLLKQFKGGFNTGHGFLREPGSIRSAASLACISVQASQNDLYGGQGVAAFDFVMAPYVNKSFYKSIKNKLIEGSNFILDKEVNKELLKEIEKNINKLDKNKIRYASEETLEYIKDFCKSLMNTKVEDTQHLVKEFNDKFANNVFRMACEEVEEETKQAMEALVHNFNTLHSRAGKVSA